MIVLNLTAGTTTDDTNISMTQSMLTNSAISYTNGIAQITSPGIYEIDGTSVITSTASGNYGVSVYSDKNIISESLVSANAASEISTIPLYGVINVTSTNTNSYVNVSIMPTGNPTIISGSMSIKRIS